MAKSQNNLEQIALLIFIGAVALIFGPTIFKKLFGTTAQAATTKPGVAGGTITGPPSADSGILAQLLASVKALTAKVSQQGSSAAKPNSAPGTGGLSTAPLSRAAAAPPVPTSVAGLLAGGYGTGPQQQVLSQIYNLQQGYTAFGDSRLTDPGTQVAGNESLFQLPTLDQNQLLTNLPDTSWSNSIDFGSFSSAAGADQANLDIFGSSSASSFDPYSYFGLPDYSADPTYSAPETTNQSDYFTLDYVPYGDSMDTSTATPAQGYF